MTCAACAARVERKLNKLDGVSATVNYATERARVQCPGGTDPRALIEQVERAGYSARRVDDVACGEDDAGQAVRVADLRLRLAVAAVLAVPICDLSLALSLFPELRFTGWQWVCMALAAPVVGWCALPFHRAAFNGAAAGHVVDGHPGVGGRARGLRVVLVGDVQWRRGRAGARPGLVRAHRQRPRPVSRCRRGCHHLPAGWALFRGAGQAIGRRGDAGAARVGRKGRRNTPRRATAARPGIRACRRRPVHRPAGREDRHRRGGRGGPLRVGRRAWSPANRCPARWWQATRWSAARSTRAGGWFCGPPGSAPTPSSPGWPGWCSAPRRERPAAQRLADRVAAVFVPAVLVLGLLTSLGWLLAGQPAGHGGHRGRGRAGGGLPVRARPRHADCAAGRHRPRRAAGDLH